MDDTLNLNPFCEVLKPILVDGLKNDHHLVSIQNFAEIKLEVLLFYIQYARVRMAKSNSFH